jgi:23S rRNA (pseudouridine1915-N3)-methyltransferase
MPKWVTLASAEYLSRINHGKYSCNIIEIKSIKNPHKLATENMALEAKKIQAHIPRDSFVVALDERGLALNSLQLAHKLQSIALTNPNITFLIGGADGLDCQLKSQANLQLQLSSLTFPHGLVRVMIVEQLYRAISILDNHPYHRE